MSLQLTDMIQFFYQKAYSIKSIIKFFPLSAVPTKKQNTEQFQINMFPFLYSQKTLKFEFFKKYLKKEIYKR